MFDKYVRFAVTALSISAMVTTLNAVTISRDEKAEILNNVNAFTTKLPIKTQSLYTKLNSANEAPARLSVEQLERIVSAALALAPIRASDDAETRMYRKALVDAQEKLVNILSSYHISGIAFSVDPNGAFIWDNQDPEISVNFTNEKGEVMSRRYQASIDSIGLKAEFALKLDAFFFTTPASFYETNKVIELGKGIEVQVTGVVGLSFMYVPFVNIPGGMFILALPFGITFPALSMVTGGTLTPIN